MATMREIKRRRVSIQNTQQITKAMKLVSTVKLQRAKTRAENSKAYFKYMYKTITSMLAKAGNVNHPFVQGNGSDKVAVVTVTSNRGLAGGYNANIIKLVTGSDFAKENVRVYSVGKKGADGLARRGYKVVTENPDYIEEPTYAQAQELSKKLLNDF